MQLPNAPDHAARQAMAASHLMAAMTAGQSAVELRRLRGLGIAVGDGSINPATGLPWTAADIAKLTWWQAASTPVKVAVVAGGAVAVLGLGYGIYKMTKKSGGLSGTHRRHRRHRRSRR